MGAMEEVVDGGTPMTKAGRGWVLPRDDMNDVDDDRKVVD